MPNYNQAPVIAVQGTKNRDSKGWGKAIRTHELETILMTQLGSRDMAMLKIMLFLTGNAEGFAVAEKTICERCNISESGYKKARKSLIDMGWITLQQGKEIRVNYDNIYGITENTPSNDLEKNKGITENTPLRYIENTPLGITENTHNNITNNINDNIIKKVIPVEKEETAEERRLRYISEMVKYGNTY